MQIFFHTFQDLEITQKFHSFPDSVGTLMLAKLWWTPVVTRPWIKQSRLFINAFHAVWILFLKDFFCPPLYSFLFQHPSPKSMKSAVFLFTVTSQSFHLSRYALCFHSDTFCCVTELWLYMENKVISGLQHRVILVI